MGIESWSTTAANNTDTPPYGAPIGTTRVNQVDNIIRENMASVRSYYENPEWRDLGDTPTYTAATTFTLSGDKTSQYLVGQRIRVTDSSTLYGVISDCSYSAPDTTVTVTLDSGSLTASLSAVAIGFNSTGEPIPLSAIYGLLNEIAINRVPSGVISQYAGVSAPTGWLMCYGQSVSRATYANLFSAIGTTYGNGDGSTTFTLPDFRGRVAFGLDNMGGTDSGRLSAANTLGGSGGSEKKTTNTDSHVLTASEIPSHYHVQGLYIQGTLASSTRYGVEDTGTNAAYFEAGGSGTGTVGSKTSSVGSGSGHMHGITSFDVMPPYLLTNYIIKV